MPAPVIPYVYAPSPNPPWDDFTSIIFSRLSASKIPSVTPAKGKAISSAILKPLIYPCEYRILRVRSCNHSAERPVSSTELMGGGENGPGPTDGFTRGFVITTPGLGCSVSSDFVVFKLYCLLQVISNAN